MNIESRLYHFGLGAGLPYPLLNSFANAFDVALNAADLGYRRKIAQQILDGSRWKGFIPSDIGVARIGADTLPRMKEAIAAANAVIEDRRKNGNWKKRRNNPFYQCECPDDILNYPEIIEFAISDAVLQIVSDYYGMVPQLKEIGIWLTLPQDHQFSSQLYHLDKPECRLVKLFVNLASHEADSGPLTLLPANVSNTVRRRTHYESIYFRGDGRLKDEEVFAYCSSENQVELDGSAGTGGFADTSNCFHFGSRCQTGERRMLTVNFMLPHKARERRTPFFDVLSEPSDEVRRLVLSGAKFNKQ